MEDNILLPVPTTEAMEAVREERASGGSRQQQPDLAQPGLNGAEPAAAEQDSSENQHSSDEQDQEELAAQNAMLQGAAACMPKMVLECRSKRATVLGGHKYHIDSLNVLLPDGKVALLSEWVLEMCLQKKERSPEKEEEITLRLPKVVEYDGKALEPRVPLLDWCRRQCATAGLPASAPAGSRLLIYWDAQRHEEQARDADRGVTWWPINLATQPEHQVHALGVWFSARVVGYNEQRAALTVTYDYDKSPEEYTLLLPLCYTHFGKQPPAPGRRMQLLPARAPAAASAASPALSAQQRQPNQQLQQPRSAQQQRHAPPAAAGAGPSSAGAKRPREVPPDDGPARQQRRTMERGPKRADGNGKAAESGKGAAAACAAFSSSSSSGDGDEIMGLLAAVSNRPVAPGHGANAAGNQPAPPPASTQVAGPAQAPPHAPGSRQLQPHAPPGAVPPQLQQDHHQQQQHAANGPHPAPPLARPAQPHPVRLPGIARKSTGLSVPARPLAPFNATRLMQSKQQQQQPRVALGAGSAGRLPSSGAAAAAGGDAVAAAAARPPASKPASAAGSARGAAGARPARGDKRGGGASSGDDDDVPLMVRGALHQARAHATAAAAIPPQRRATHDAGKQQPQPRDKTAKGAASQRASGAARGGAPSPAGASRKAPPIGGAGPSGAAPGSQGRGSSKKTGSGGAGAPQAGSKAGARVGPAGAQQPAEPRPTLRSLWGDDPWDYMLGPSPNIRWQLPQLAAPAAASHAGQPGAAPAPAPAPPPTGAPGPLPPPQPALLPPLPQPGAAGLQLDPAEDDFAFVAAGFGEAAALPPAPAPALLPAQPEAPLALLPPAVPLAQPAQQEEVADSQPEAAPPQARPASPVYDLPAEDSECSDEDSNASGAQAQAPVQPQPSLAPSSSAAQARLAAAAAPAAAGAPLEPQELEPAPAPAPAPAPEQVVAEPALSAAARPASPVYQLPPEDSSDDEQMS